MHLTLEQFINLAQSIALLIGAVIALVRVIPPLATYLTQHGVMKSLETIDHVAGAVVAEAAQYEKARPELGKDELFKYALTRAKTYLPKVPQQQLITAIEAAVKAGNDLRKECVPATPPAAPE